jgi:hypothetical protein
VVYDAISIFDGFFVDDLCSCTCKSCVAVLKHHISVCLERQENKETKLLFYVRTDCEAIALHPTFINSIQLKILCDFDSQNKRHG